MTNLILLYFSHSSHCVISPFLLIPLWSLQNRMIHSLFSINNDLCAYYTKKNEGNKRISIEAHRWKAVGHAQVSLADRRARSGTWLDQVRCLYKWSGDMVDVQLDMVDVHFDLVNVQFEHFEVPWWCPT